ncbi:unnamed protein product [Blepharisma stoltei]|uniref:Uncharacterized protein n=1 Tax=Blepharisma stoltei TaxID=1481888 RepID=A0AAU9IJ86_9CILI|nr:unnamed protein product [Blepharisma stoltei]
MSESEDVADAIFKLLIIGDSGIGKSCFLLQFTEGRFKDDHAVTIGVEYGSKMLTVNDKRVKLQIWDTAGQEDYRSITRSFYRNAHGIILMYDLTRTETFDHLPDWLKEARQNAGNDVMIFLVANVLDLADEEREVFAESGRAFAQENKLSGFIEASAKTSENVKDVFTKFSEILYQKHGERMAKEASKVVTKPLAASVIIKPTQPKKKGCC